MNWTNTVSVTDPKSFIARAKKTPIIDVRSPGEFREGHIPGATNIPLFDDAERAEIGTLYKQSGRQAAIFRGLEVAGAKLLAIAKQAINIATEGQVLVHCWRGGMRSQSFAWAIEQVDLEVELLEGGYKAYRRMVHSDFENQFQFVVLGGLTGTGKTDLLQLLSDAGEQIINLEHLANHGGSAFGGFGQADQPTVEQFENQLHLQLSKLDLNRQIWVEDESRRIGKIPIPEAIHRQMRQAPSVRVNVSQSERAIYLAQTYGQLPASELEKGIHNIRKRLGGLRVQQAVAALNAGDTETCARICLEYYDKAYCRSAELNARPLTIEVAATKSADPQVVDELVRTARQIRNSEVGA